MKRFLFSLFVLLALSAVVVRTQNIGGANSSGILDFVAGKLTIGGIQPVVASSPGVGLAHFAGSTNTATSSAVTAADATGNTSGSGNFCLTTNCVMATPNLGTPSAVNLANATNVPATGPKPDPTTSFLVDEFIGLSSSSQTVGQLGWTLTAIGSTGFVNGIAPAQPNLGIIQLLTNGAAGAGNGEQMNLQAANTTTATLTNNLQSTTGWEIQFIFQFLQTASIRNRIGIGGTSGTVVPANGLFLRCDTNASFNDTDFIFESITAGVSTTIDTTIACDTNWHRVKITSTVSGTGILTLYSAAGAVQATKSLAISIVATSGMSPMVIVGTNTSAQKSINVDYFSWYMSGLAR
jgi:hypothetical protein